jgi:5-methylcytosine-specific restriction endonuclease McrA
MTPEQYQQRAESLRTLGFSSYQDYLRSPIWRFVRGLVMKRCRGQCESCRINRASQVHHTSYSVKVLLGHKLKRLVGVCDMCHEMAHETELDPTVRKERRRQRHELSELERSYRRVGALGQPRDMTHRLRRGANTQHQA